MEGNNIQCYSNVIDSTGYNGIYFLGDSVHIKNNFISHFCFILDDGGGIYTWNGDNKKHKYRKVEENIVINGIGNLKGTNFSAFSLARGIYLDHTSDHVLVINNTTANCAGAGIFANIYSHDNSIIGNTSYNNYEQINLILRDPESLFPNKNYTVLNNIFFSKTSLQQVAYFVTSYEKDLLKIGNINYNYYCRPVNEDRTISISYSNKASSVYKHIDLSTWQKNYANDKNSSVSPFTLPVYEITDTLGTNKFNNGTFDKNISGWLIYSNYNNGMISWDNINPENGCMRISFGKLTQNADAYLSVYSLINHLEANENYLVRFSLTASAPGKKVRIYLRKADAPYTNLSEGQAIITTTNQQEYELLFTPSVSESNARIDFEIEEDNTIYWLDNSLCFHVGITKTITEDSIRFFYNASAKPLQVIDNNYYIDIKGNKYKNFTLKPYASLVLFEVTEDYYKHSVKSQEKPLIYVYPNPAYNSVNIITNDNSNKLISIYDSKGRMVFQNNVDQNNITLNIHALSKGIYILKMKGGIIGEQVSPFIKM
jgi:hypothetical protein